MKLIGLTGGIGSGKSTVGNLLAHKNIPVYFSDKRAHNIMNESEKVVTTLKQWFGNDIYVDGKLDRERLGSIVFASKEKLEELNALVHPEVFKDFDDWKSEQTSEFIIKEAAILFESGSYKDCDIILTVSAPEEVRIIRTMARDKKSREEVMDRISKQWTDEQREQKADYVIKNDGSFMELEREVEQFYYWLKH